MAFKRVTILNAQPTARSRRVAQLQGLLAEEETAAGCLVGNYFGNVANGKRKTARTTTLSNLGVCFTQPRTHTLQLRHSTYSIIISIEQRIVVDAQLAVD